MSPRTLIVHSGSVGRTDMRLSVPRVKLMMEVAVAREKERCEQAEVWKIHFGMEVAWSLKFFFTLNPHDGGARKIVGDIHTERSTLWGNYNCILLHADLDMHIR